MRKMASIQTINKIEPIDGADSIETAYVNGWTSVIKKGEFKVGDRIIYCEIDSWIPHKLAPFLSKGSTPRQYNGVVGEKLRTIRLRGQLSQGLILPITVLDGLVESLWLDGLDVSAPLNIQKWEAPVPAELVGTMKGGFPSQIPKTDQERVQNIDLSKHYGKSFEVTEKLEGTSMTCYLIDGEFGVCSRNLDIIKDENNLYWKVAIAEKIEEKMRKVFGNQDMAIQGELVGVGVQNNYYAYNEQTFFVFDIYDIQDGKYLKPSVTQFYTDELSLKHVPYITIYDISDTTTLEELIEYASSEMSYIKPSLLREGVVFKNLDDSNDSFKVINNIYLLKN